MNEKDEKIIDMSMKDGKVIDMLMFDIITSKEIVSNILKKYKEDCSEFALNNRIREFKGELLNKFSIDDIEKIAKIKEKILRKQIDE